MSSDNEDDYYDDYDDDDDDDDYSDEDGYEDEDDDDVEIAEHDDHPLDDDDDHSFPDPTSPQDDDDDASSDEDSTGLATLAIDENGHEERASGDATVSTSTRHHTNDSHAYSDDDEKDDYSDHDRPHTPSWDAHSRGGRSGARSSASKSEDVVRPSDPPRATTTGRYSPPDKYFAAQEKLAGYYANTCQYPQCLPGVTPGRERLICFPSPVASATETDARGHATSASTPAYANSGMSSRPRAYEGTSIDRYSADSRRRT